MPLQRLLIDTMTQCVTCAMPLQPTPSPSALGGKWFWTLLVTTRRQWLWHRPTGRQIASRYFFPTLAKAPWHDFFKKMYICLVLHDQGWLWQVWQSSGKKIYFPIVDFPLSPLNIFQTFAFHLQYINGQSDGCRCYHAPSVQVINPTEATKLTRDVFCWVGSIPSLTLHVWSNFLGPDPVFQVLQVSPKALSGTYE